MTIDKLLVVEDVYLEHAIEGLKGLREQGIEVYTARCFNEAEMLYTAFTRAGASGLVVITDLCYPVEPKQISSRERSLLIPLYEEILEFNRTHREIAKELSKHRSHHSPDVVSYRLEYNEEQLRTRIRELSEGGAREIVGPLGILLAEKARGANIPYAIFTDPGHSNPYLPLFITRGFLTEEELCSMVNEFTNYIARPVEERDQQRLEGRLEGKARDTFDSSSGNVHFSPTYDKYPKEWLAIYKRISAGGKRK